jgi:DNA-directed RNA polymerase specialized sigma24 family protein
LLANAEKAKATVAKTEAMAAKARASYRDALVKADDAGVSKPLIAQRLGVTRIRVYQLLSEARRK